MKKANISPIVDIIEEARKGKPFILIDDESRENEGDLVVPAEKITPEIINFMITHCKGLVCMPITSERARDLDLPPMSVNNGSKFKTAFTVSIEAREGITTGISAFDRARTIQVAANMRSSARDICSPGHIFPLIAKDGGVLVRAGHTEASVDISRLAGLNPSSVICEIIKDDGTMARLPDLLIFAEKHNLKIGTIADLIEYRRVREKLVNREVESIIDTKHAGKFKLIIYKASVENEEHIAMIKGSINPEKPVLVRMHAVNVLADVIGDSFEGKEKDLHNSMKMIEEEGNGAIVIIRDHNRTNLADLVRARNGEIMSDNKLRDYGLGAQILVDLGIKKMNLLTNKKKMVIALDAYGLEINDFVPIKDFE